MRVNTKRFLSSFYISILYLITSMLVHNSNFIIANLLMSISVFLGLMFAINTEHGIITIRNVVYFIYFVIGFYVRYIVIGAYKDLLMEFAPSPLANIAGYHVKTAFVTLICTLLYSLAFIINNKCRRDNKSLICPNSNVNDIKHKQFDRSFLSNKSVFVFFVILIPCCFYQFINIRYAVSGDYGQFDNLIRFFSLMTQILAYCFLAEFNRSKRKKYLVYYLFYLIPTLALGALQGFKVSFLFETMILIIALSGSIKIIKIKYIILIATVAFVIFPVISIYRSNLIYDSNMQINATTILEYNKTNNVIEYYSNRLQYYDEAYYVINAPQQDLDTYRTEAKGIISRFFSGLIPRAFWSNKPVVNVGKYVTYTLLHYNPLIYNNLTIGFIGDAFASYSYMGLFVFMFIYAYSISKLEKIKNTTLSISQLGLYLAGSYKILSFLEGDIAAKSLELVLLIISYFILYFVLKVKRTSS